MRDRPTQPWLPFYMYIKANVTNETSISNILCNLRSYMALAVQSFNKQRHFQSRTAFPGGSSEHSLGPAHPGQVYSGISIFVLGISGR